MPKILLLYTNFGPPYWDREGKPARYTKRSFTQLRDWHELKKSLPVPALGIHFNKYKDLPFSYMTVIGMEYDDQGFPTFDYRCIQKSERASAQLLEKLHNPAIGTLFEARDATVVLSLLTDLGEQPPQEWVTLLSSKQTLPTLEAWREWVGQHFLHLLDPGISNDDFEDVIAEIFRALGFEVNQMGHKRVGSYPDGTLVPPTADFAIVYDCKNTDNYYPTAEHQRALAEYLEKEGKRLQEQKRVRSVYSMFIARSFAQAELKGAHIFISADDLLYALFKRLRLGKDFALTAFDDLAKRNGRIDRQFMDREWAEIPVS